MRYFVLLKIFEKIRGILVPVTWQPFPKSKTGMPHFGHSLGTFILAPS